MNTNPADVSGAPVSVSPFRRLVALLVWLALAVVVVQAAVAVGSRLHGLPGGAIGAVLAMVAVALIAHRHPLGTWTRVAVLAVLVAPGWIYLSTDEAALLPTPIPPLPVAPTGAERASYETTLRFALRPGTRPVQEFMSPKLEVPLPFGRPGAWADYFAKHGVKAHAAWQANTVGREWLQALDAVPEIADLTPQRPGAMIMPFRPWRETVGLEVTEAMRLAAAGHGNEAVDMIVPVIRVCRKLQANSRTLVRFMSARVALDRAMAGVRFMLEKSPPDAAHRQALIAVLAAGEDGAAAIERAMWIESAYWPTLMELTPGPGWARYLPTLLHRCRTCNAMTRHTAQIAALAARRDVTGIEALQQQQLNARAGSFGFRSPTGQMQLMELPGKNAPIAFRNPLGELLLTLATPAYGRLVASYWKIEDERLGLLGRLRGWVE
jgi:hypothetical protein